MNQAYSNRIIHLMNERPEQGRRLLGIGAEALWELWQRILEMDQQLQHQRLNRPKPSETSGGWPQESGGCVVSINCGAALSETALDDAGIGRMPRLCRINAVELHPRNVALHPLGLTRESIGAMATGV